MKRKKGRDIKPGPLPMGELQEGEVILSPPAPRRLLEKYIHPARIMLRATKTVSTSVNCRNILFSKDLSIGSKLECIKAEVIIENTRLLFDREMMHQAGYRVANCVCPQGCDCRHHNHPQRITRSRQRRARRNRARGKR